MNGFQRIARLVRTAVDDLGVDLSNIRVLTEAASGPFIVTAPMAAFAGADSVVAVARDSKWGTTEEIFGTTLRLATMLGCEDRIEMHAEPGWKLASRCDLITNLGFVRPIDDDFLSRLPEGAVISLMYEPWELRKEDVNVEACRRRGVPIIGTNENQPRLNTFRYVGLLGLKLLMECGVEIYRSRIIIVGSKPFGPIIEDALTMLGANCVRYDPTEQWPVSYVDMERDLADCDAIIVAEHRDRGTMIGDGGIPADMLSPDLCIVHLCGVLDMRAIVNRGIKKHPGHDAPFGKMTVTTGYMGPQPVIDLHAGGLKVGGDLVRAFRVFGNAGDSERVVAQSGYGLPLESADYS